MTINVSTPAYRSEVDVRKRRDFPMLRASVTCPFCAGDKNTGLIACWSCHSKAFDAGDVVAANSITYLNRKERELSTPCVPLDVFGEICRHLADDGALSDRYGSSNHQIRNEGRYAVVAYLSQASADHRRLLAAWNFYDLRRDVLSPPPSDPCRLTIWLSDAGYPVAVEHLEAAQ